MDCESGIGATDYWTMEREANTFAAELLMPEEYIRGRLKREASFAKVNVQVADQCEVSPMAAARQMAKFLDAGIVYAAEKSGEVAFSGRTEGTVAPCPSWGSVWDSDIFDYATSHFESSRRDVTLHWWVLPARMNLRSSDSREWRDILQKILSEICIDPDRREKLRQSINGVVAYANSICKRTNGYSVATVASAAMQRFKHNNEYQQFCGHPDFEAFLKNRIRSLFQK